MTEHELRYQPTSAATDDEAPAATGDRLLEEGGRQSGPHARLEERQPATFVIDLVRDVCAVLRSQLEARPGILCELVDDLAEEAEDGVFWNIAGGDHRRIDDPKGVRVKFQNRIVGDLHAANIPPRRPYSQPASAAPSPWRVRRTTGGRSVGIKELAEPFNCSSALRARGQPTQRPTHRELPRRSRP